MLLKCLHIEPVFIDSPTGFGAMAILPLLCILVMFHSVQIVFMVMLIKFFNRHPFGFFDIRDHSWIMVLVRTSVFASICTILVFILCFLYLDIGIGITEVTSFTSLVMPMFCSVRLFSTSSDNTPSIGGDSGNDSNDKTGSAEVQPGTEGVKTPDTDSAQEVDLGASDPLSESEINTAFNKLTSSPSSTGENSSSGDSSLVQVKEIELKPIGQVSLDTRDISSGVIILVIQGVSWLSVNFQQLLGNLSGNARKKLARWLTSKDFGVGAFPVMSTGVPQLTSGNEENLGGNSSTLVVGNTSPATENLGKQQMTLFQKLVAINKFFTQILGIELTVNSISVLILVLRELAKNGYVLCARNPNNNRYVPISKDNLEGIISSSVAAIKKKRQGGRGKGKDTKGASAPK